MAFIVVYDACVLHPAPLRDLLIRIAQAGVVRARWTDAILDECFRSILARKPDIDREKLDRTRELMTQAVRDCVVTGYEPLIAAVSLPDPNDRHVVAAAVRAGAQVIVTFNTRDFPAEALAEFDLEAKHPDDFILESIDLAAGRIAGVVTEQAADLRNPPRTAREVLDTLAGLGLTRAVARLREML